nr:MAG TPA: hypothetical protein [Caudoviricetes sp.]
MRILELLYKSLSETLLHLDKLYHQQKKELNIL